MRHAASGAILPKRAWIACNMHHYLNVPVAFPIPLQGIPLSNLKFRRLLFGGFPCYPDASPLPPAFDRVMQIGDAAAMQPPLSFGGFGSMVSVWPRNGWVWPGYYMLQIGKWSWVMRQ